MILNSPYISGSLTVTGNEVVTGSLTVLGGITGVITGSATSASYASNAELLDGLDSSVFVLSSSFQNYSSSNDGKVAALNTFSASILSYTSSTDDKIAQLNRETASLNLATASLYAATSSIYNFTSSANLRIGSLEQYTQSLNTRSASFACVTATNNFACTQYFSNASNAVSFTSTGSLYSDGGMRLTKDLYVSGTSYFNNVTIFGTQSVAYISSSQLNIGTNIISVNTDTPSIRFGGLAVYDSGSTGLTGSILWDSEANHWVYTNPSGSTYSGGMFISGPRASSLGTEQGTTSCMLLAGQGGDHLTSSMIYHDSTVTCIPNTLIGSTVCGSTSTFSSTSTACNFVTSGNTLFGITLKGRSSDNYGAIGFYSSDGGTRYGYLQSHSTNCGQLIVNGDGGGQAIFDCRGVVLTSALTGTTSCFSGNMTTAGCIGIGTNAAATPLHIATTGLPAIRLTLGSEARCHNINGVNLGRDLQVLPFRHFSVQTGNGITEGQIVLNAYEDFIVGTGASYTQRLILNSSGNLGLGVTPSAWSASWTAQQFGQAGSLFAFKSGSNYTVLSNNSYAIGGGYQSGDARYINNGLSTAYIQNNSGQHLWMNAPSGTAGNAISFTQAMTLNASGNLSIGNTNDTYKLDVNGTGNFSTARANYFDIPSGTGFNAFQMGADTFSGGWYVYDATNGSYRFKIANSGAATFSSSVSAVAGNFSGDVTIAKTTPGLILNGLGSGNSGAYVNFQGWAASNKNWQIGVANIGPAGLLFTPSTAAGGTTFSSPVFTLSDAGAATFSSSVTATGNNAYVFVGTGATTGYQAAALSNTGGNLNWGVAGSNGSFWGSGGGGAYYGTIGTTNATAFVIATNNAGRMLIDSSGNIGIGTTSPGYKLEVAGNVRIQDTLSLTNGDSGQAVFTNNSTAVSVSTTTALGGSFSMGGSGAFVIVYGSQSTNVFIDTIIAANTGTPTVLNSTTVSGSPSARTYSTASNRLQLAMASGTYDVRINILRIT
jgi:hypothetical protein